MSESWTTLKLIQWTAGYFEKATIPNPRLDAELLLAHVLKCKRIDLYTRHEDLLRENHLAEFKGLMQRRVKREPLQYIVGETEFYGLPFKVTPAVLIPRPETELLVEEALKSAAALTPASCGTRPSGSDRSSEASVNATAAFLQILDIGTGSGCIAITLAKHLPNAKIVATDISQEALEIARGNAQRHEVIDQIEFVLADISPWKRLAAETRQFDLILSNPPYIATGELETLQPEVRDFEPRQALDGGAEGLAFIRKILEEAPSFLKPNGLLLMEIGENQGDQLRALLDHHEVLELAGLKKDLSGCDRLLIAHRKL